MLSVAAVTLLLDEDATIQVTVVVPSDAVDQSEFGLSLSARRADDANIFNIATRDLVVLVDETDVPIDIMPGTDTNPINLHAQGRIPVALLSTPEILAPDDIDVQSLTFGGTGTEVSLAFCSGAEDVNGDGVLDIVCHFEHSLAAFMDGDTEDVLKGTTLDGQSIVGRNLVAVLGSASRWFLAEEAEPVIQAGLGLASSKSRPAHRSVCRARGNKIFPAPSFRCRKYRFRPSGNRSKFHGTAHHAERSKTMDPFFVVYFIFGILILVLSVPLIFFSLFEGRLARLVEASYSDGSARS